MASSPKPPRAERHPAPSPADLYGEVQRARLALTGAVEQLKAARPGARAQTVRRAVALYMRLRRANERAEACLAPAPTSVGTAVGPAP